MPYTVLRFLAPLLLATAVNAADALPKPEIPDPFGLGERLALLEHLKTELHATVEPGATYEDLVKQYWDIVDAPKREAEAANQDRIQRLRARLAEFAITADGESDPDKLAKMIADAERKATLHGVDEKQEEAAVVEKVKDPASAMATGSALQLTIPGGTDIEVKIPSQWVMKRTDADATHPLTLNLTTAQGDVILQISVFADKSTDCDSQEKLDEQLRGIAPKFLEGAVEKTVTPRKLMVPGGFGGYVECTGSPMIAKRGAPDRFKVIAFGMVVIGTSVAPFTLLGESFDQASYVGAKQVLEGMGKKK